ncbi:MULTISPECIES: HEAT repeat domain-containing protein [Burkholderia cepacia complex]|uniref:HEAT repeat domain-containing protein n=1 Tax=Burkholderia cepacia TaxID=292 RepID=UPI0009BC9A99|nr:HEAT repeat domain-containing protein [Burkholderia cepacia]
MADTQAAIETLIKVLNNTTAGVSIRSAAAEGLGFAGGPEARNALIAVLNNTTAGVDVRSAAARALGHAVHH